MAEQGRREVVPDQLAFNAREQAPERSLATMGVRNPGLSAGPAPTSTFKALGSLQDALGKAVSGMAEDAITTGKLKQMQGVSEAEILATGNKYERLGWESLSSIDQANSWVLNEEQNIVGGTDQMDPDQYQKHLMDARAQALAGLPDDPQIRKLYAAAFEDKGPALVAKQMAAHNAYNEGKTQNELTNALLSSSVANHDATRVMPGSTLRVSPTRIDTAIMGTAEDRDIGILTMLGEAGGEGDVGLAAVAHVLKNRSLDKRWGGSISKVALAPKQFSTWNSGAGGNGPTRLRGSAAYERAGQVYDAVMNGLTTDITNGATHYYSPAGMKQLVKNGDQTNLVPGWLATETARSGGGIKIGGHIFAGKTGLGGVTPIQDQTVTESGMPEAGAGLSGRLDFVNAGQDAIDPGFKGLLTEASAAMGMPLKITSGYRSPNHPVEASKKNGPGEHSHKDAADIDMTGMNDAQRQQLVAELRSRGMKRFGTYGNSPNMLHVDMNAKQVSPDDWFMFDRSKNNLGNAPAWFQQAAQATSGQQLPEGNVTQTRTLLMNAPGRAGIKATAAADAMRRQFDQGSDQLFNDLGGIGVLYDLGAKPNEIDEVLQAKKRMEQKQLDSFDIGFERQRTDLFEKIRNGQFGTLEEAQGAVDQMYQGKQVNDQQARSLVREVAGAWEKERTGENALLPQGFLEDTTAIYRKVDGGLMSTEESWKAIEGVASEYNVDPKTAQKFLQKVYTVDDGKYARDRSKAEQALKEQQKSDALKAQAETALGSDMGLKSLPTGDVDVGGAKMSVRQYAIDKLKNDEAAAIRNGIKQGDIKPENGPSLLYNNVYTKLARNDIVDEKSSSAMQASILGNIFENKNGKPAIRQSALETFDTYMQLAENPNIPDGYLARMFPSPDARSLLEQASQFYSLDTDMETALGKAYERLHEKDFDKTSLSTKYGDTISKKIDDAITQTAGNNGFLNSITGGLFAPTLPSFEEALLTTERSKASQYVRNRADAYHNMNPRQDPEVSINMALKDFQNDSLQVHGKLVLGDHSRGERLDQKMGIEDYGKQAPNDAVSGILEAFGKDMWPAQWEASVNRYWTPRAGTDSIPMDVNYSAASGMVGFQLLDDKGSPQGDMHFMSAYDIGRWYKAKKAKEGPGFISRAYDSTMDFIIEDDRQGQARLKDAAKRFQAMPKQ